jgi:hypothetical protein
MMTEVPSLGLRVTAGPAERASMFFSVLCIYGEVRRFPVADD